VLYFVCENARDIEQPNLLPLNEFAEESFLYKLMFTLKYIVFKIQFAFHDDLITIRVYGRKYVASHGVLINKN